ncbi:MAG: hypothetical protein Ct9H300mP11_17910 [Chloroflexota bacterium]|nr:MAG: hypothetical protein Ct9H300mP11_17910 [Chloroflexota bacterium]
MSFEMIKTDQVDRVAIVTLNRPEVLNALNPATVRELDEFVTDAKRMTVSVLLLSPVLASEHSLPAQTSIKTGRILRRASSRSGAAG